MNEIYAASQRRDWFFRDRHHNLRWVGGSDQAWAQLAEYTARHGAGATVLYRDIQFGPMIEAEQPS